MDETGPESGPAAGKTWRGSSRRSRTLPLHGEGVARWGCLIAKRTYGRRERTARIALSFLVVLISSVLLGSVPDSSFEDRSVVFFQHAPPYRKIGFATEQRSEAGRNDDDDGVFVAHCLSPSGVAPGREKGTWHNLETSPSISGKCLIPIRIFFSSAYQPEITIRVVSAKRSRTCPRLDARRDAEAFAVNPRKVLVGFLVARKGLCLWIEGEHAAKAIGDVAEVG